MDEIGKIEASGGDIMPIITEVTRTYSMRLLREWDLILRGVHASLMDLEHPFTAQRLATVIVQLKESMGDG